MKRKVIGRVLYHTDYEFIEDGDKHLATVGFALRADEGSMVCGNQAYRIQRKSFGNRNFELYQFHSEFQSIGEKIAVQNLGRNELNQSLGVTYSGKEISFRSHTILDWLLIDLPFRRLRQTITDQKQNTGTMESAADGYHFEYWGSAPKEIQTFLFWLMLHKLTAPRDI